MFLFNPTAAPRQNLAEAIREEERQEIESWFNRMLPNQYTKRTNRSNRVKVVDGIPYQAAGGGRRRLSTRADY